MTQLASLLELSEDLLWLHFLVFLRVGPAVSLFPGLGEQTVPMRVKLGLALALTIVSAPALAPTLEALIDNPPPLGWIILTETAVGLLIGIGTRLFLLALQTAGSIAAQATSLSQIFGSAGIEPMAALGYVLVIGGLALAMMAGLHIRLAELIILTYALFPAGNLPDGGAVGEWGVRQVSATFALAFTLAAPFVVVSVIYNLTLGIINRAMPQMMVVFVGAPVITGVGLILLVALGPTLLKIWLAAFSAFLGNPFGGS